MNGRPRGSKARYASRAWAILGAAALKNRPRDGAADAGMDPQADTGSTHVALVSAAYEAVGALVVIRKVVEL